MPGPRHARLVTLNGNGRRSGRLGKAACARSGAGHPRLRDRAWPPSYLLRRTPPPPQVPPALGSRPSRLHRTANFAVRPPTMTSNSPVRVLHDWPVFESHGRPTAAPAPEASRPSLHLGPRSLSRTHCRPTRRLIRCHDIANGQLHHLLPGHLARVRARKTLTTSVSFGLNDGAPSLMYQVATSLAYEIARGRRPNPSARFGRRRRRCPALRLIVRNDGAWNLG